MTKRKWYSPSKHILVSCAVAAVFAASSVAHAQTANEGPSGGQGGGTFYDSVPDPAYIDYIVVRSGAVVDAIQTVWNTGAMSPVRGGDGGSVNIFNPTGRVNRVWGYSGTYSGNGTEVVISIGFCTNSECSIRYGGGREL